MDNDAPESTKKRKLLCVSWRKFNSGLVERKAVAEASEMAGWGVAFSRGDPGRERRCYAGGHHHTVRRAGNRCCQFRISTCTVFISESVVSSFLTPVTGARCRQQSLPAECGQVPCPGPGSNPGRGKGNFFWVAH